MLTHPFSMLTTWLSCGATGYSRRYWFGVAERG